MTFLPWSKQYSVRIRLVDNDHKELFDMVNQLHTAIEQRKPAQEVSFAIALLARYVKDHFEREEQLMADYGYPWLAQHKAEHQRLRHMVQAIRKIHTRTPTKLDPEKLLDFLRDWLVTHILGSDMKYADYLRGNRAQTQSGKNGAQDGGHAQNGGSESATEAVHIAVPAGKADLIRRLARVLQDGGEDAEALVGFAETVGGIDYDEACCVAAALLR